MKKLSDLLFTIDPDNPEPEIIGAGAKILKKGGVIIFPTRGLYGLGASAFDPDAGERIFRIKGRPSRKPILVLIAQRSDLEDLAAEIPPHAVRIMERFWPGPVTLVFRAKGKNLSHLTAGTGKIGIRLCSHPAAAALVQAAGMPITGTSANLSGQAGASGISDIDHRVRGSVDMIIDSGPLAGGPGSTIVDVTADPPQILREGSVPPASIAELF